MSVVINSTVENWVVEDRNMPKNDRIRFKLIDMKHLIVLGTKETLKMMSLARV